MAREPLANGFLSGKYRPDGAITAVDDWRSHIDRQEVRDRLHAVVNLRATEVPSGVSMATWAIAWCLQNPTVAAVITGAKSVEQLESSAAVDLAVKNRNETRP